MGKYRDKMGIFEDFNFKLAVVEALLNKDPAFKPELNEMINRYTNHYKWYTNSGPIEEMLEFFSELFILKQDLDKVTKICFDGRNEIYTYIHPDWDGENNFFDISSVKGFEYLPSLESVERISMVSEDTLRPMIANGVTVI